MPNLDLSAKPRDLLEELLGESPASARNREQTTFQKAAGGRDQRIVLFGAGGLGRRTLAGLRSAGIGPLAFSDNRPELWGTDIDGLTVLPPEEAAAAFGSNATFVVTIWGAGSTHRLAHSQAQLQKLGCETVLPPAWLYWRYPEQLLPFYALDLPSHLLEDAQSIRQCFDLWSDEASRREFVAQVNWRLSGDPSGLGHPDPGEQYLVADVAKERGDEVVLDCGAYDGDTLRAWLSVRGPTFRTYFAMEPDPLSRQRLESSLTELDPAIANRVRVLPYSVSDYTGSATFSASGSLSSAMQDGPGITVQCTRLDDLEPELGGEAPTFLKMDVEGAELDALTGGQSLLRRTHPMIAIATYHRQDHLWKVPLAVNDLWSQYDFYLRPHNEEGWDLILYAVPPNRSLID
jgi:FkbM family methyltransferase